MSLAVGRFEIKTTTTTTTVSLFLSAAYTQLVAVPLEEGIPLNCRHRRLNKAKEYAQDYSQSIVFVFFSTFAVSLHGAYIP